MSYLHGIFLLSYWILTVIADDGCVTNVDISEFPFMVSIQNNNGDHICSGVILQKKMVYTWADLKGVDYNSIEATAGITKLTDSGQKRGIGIIPPIDTVLAGSTNFFNMLVKPAFDLDDQVQVGEINKGDIRGDITFVGWGPEEGANLQKLTLEIMSDSDCEKLVESNGASSDITSYICGKTRDVNCEEKCFEGKEGPIVQNSLIVGKRYRMDEPLCFPGEYIFLRDMGINLN